VLLYQFLRKWRQSVQDQWAKKKFFGSSIYDDALTNAGAVGTIEAIDQLLDLTWEQVSETLGETDE
jgi:hypothetical protein